MAVLVDRNIGKHPGERMTGSCFHGVDEFAHCIQHRHLATIKNFSLKETQDLNAMVLGADEMGKGRQ